MDLRAAILEEHSKSQVSKIVQWIGTDERKVEQLMRLFAGNEYRVVQRSAWIISSVADLHPGLIARYIPLLIGKMNEEQSHVAVRRNVLRILQKHPVPETMHGILMNLCFGYLCNPKETVAVRAFSMGVLARLSLIYPEIKNELRLIIEAELALSPTPGFRSKAKKVIKSIG